MHEGDARGGLRQDEWDPSGSFRFILRSSRVASLNLLLRDPQGRSFRAELPTSLESVAVTVRRSSVGSYDS